MWPRIFLCNEYQFFFLEIVHGVPDKLSEHLISTTPNTHTFTLSWLSVDLTDRSTGTSLESRFVLDSRQKTRGVFSSSASRLNRCPDSLELVSMGSGWLTYIPPPPSPTPSSSFHLHPLPPSTTLILSAFRFQISPVAVQWNRS